MSKCNFTNEICANIEFFFPERYRGEVGEVIYDKNKENCPILFEDKDKKGNTKRIYAEKWKCLKCLVGVDKFEKMTGLYDLYN